MVLGVAGVGMIGGSLALRATAAGLTVIGCDPDAAGLSAARAAGAIADTAPDLAALAVRCDAVALAMPVDALLAALTEPALAAPRLVFDVASVKVRVAAAAAHLPRFVASHPLAGREVEGFSGADAALFEDRWWVVAPGADLQARALLLALIAACGARPYELDPAEHDRLVATTSHLPQVLSVVLAARLAAAAASDPRAYELCGTGMESMLRLSRSPAGLWAGIALANAGPLGAELRAAARALDAVADGLAAGDSAALTSYFAAAREAAVGRERAVAPARSSSTRAT